MRKGSKASLETRKKMSDARKNCRGIFWVNKETGRCFVYCRNRRMEPWARILYQNYYLNGEEIPKGFVIHHKDINPSNDDVENLEMLVNGKHPIIHSKGRLYNNGEKNFMFGKHHSDETKEKIAKAHLGKTHSEEHRRKISEGNLGKRYSEEVKEKMSKSQKGKEHPKTRGENNVKAKLKETDVVKIKELLELGMLQKDIAAIFGVASITIYRIKSGKA